MSRTVGRRKSNLKVVSAYKEPPGPKLKFKWSRSAAHLAILEDNSAIILPAIASDRSQRRICTPSSLSTDKNSMSLASISTRKSSLLPNVAKQCQSPTSTERDKNSTRYSPLIVTYAQLHQSPSSSPINRQKQSRLCIFSSPDGKRDSISVVNRNLSILSRASVSSPTATISLLTTKPDSRSGNDNLVRLNSAELHRLNVSEKYHNEAKRLYFNVDCKIFTPRVSITQIS